MKTFEFLRWLLLLVSFILVIGMIISWILMMGVR